MLKQAIIRYRPLHYHLWGIISILANNGLFKLALHYPRLLGGTDPQPGEIGEMPVVLKALNYPLLLIDHFVHDLTIRSYMDWTRTQRTMYDTCLGISLMLGFLCYWYLLGNVVALALSRLKPASRTKALLAPVKKGAIFPGIDGSQS